MRGKYYGDRLKAVLPALGTHTAMRPDQIAHMFGDVPQDLFRVHNWRTDIETLGEVPAEFIREQSEGKLNYAWPAQVNRLISQGGFDLILSIGQVVPHEVIGMANYTKNILVGTGGREGINRSHYLGAVYGMERIMGRADQSRAQRAQLRLRSFPAPSAHRLRAHRGRARSRRRRLPCAACSSATTSSAFTWPPNSASRSTSKCSTSRSRKAVVYLDPSEFHSTWLGNKAIYRTRMALADGAELIILAPGVKEFGEDKTIDALIRKYGYRGTPATLDAVEANADLANDLSAAAHLIHGSSEGRFTITWCPGHLTKEEIESVGFQLWRSGNRCSSATIPPSSATAKTGLTAKRSSSSPIRD